MYYYEDCTTIPCIPQKLVYYLNYFQNITYNNGIQVCEPSIEYFTSNLSQSFAELLLHYIDRHGLKDCEVYKKAFVSRKVFHKIKSENNYHPSFRTVTMFAIALQLDLKEYEELLNSATYSLPKNMSKYIVLRYCFENKVYDIKVINEYLKKVCDITLNDL